jgi:hypothetical protein
MALPKLATAKYELTLPSTGQKVEYRPFLVKEEKTLLLAQQSGESTDMLRAVGDIISSCTFGSLDPNTMPIFDLEYVFLQLRSKSVGETASIKVTCPDDGETQVDVNIDLSKVECIKEVGHDNNVKITDTIGLVLDYPKISMLSDITDADDAGVSFDIIKKCVAQIYDADNVYVKNDMEDKDLDEFIESMSHEQFQKVSAFFDTMPKVKHTVKVTNPNTGVVNEIVLQGLSDFF